MMTAVHSGGSAAQENSFGRRIENADRVAFEERDGQKRDLAQLGHIFRNYSEVANKLAVGFVLAGVMLKKLKRQLFKQHVIVFVQTEYPFCNVLG